MYFYKNNVIYRKSTKKILLFFIIINFICLWVKYFNNSWFEALFWIDENWYIIITIEIRIGRLLIQILYSFNTIPSDYIEKNIDKLPNRIGKYPVIIQYTPPEWLSPSEVWLIYNLSYEPTNFDCLIYKWELEWIVEVEYSGNEVIHIEKKKELKDDVPKYEKLYWENIFWSWFFKYSTLYEDIDSELLNHCIEKWWLYTKHIGCKNLLVILLWIIFPPFWILLIVYIFMLQLYYTNKLWAKHIIDLSKKILRTDKWDELYAHIIWYKYWLEHCEEDQIKEILKNDPKFKSRTLPYVIALRMDWKLLDKKFSKYK